MSGLTDAADELVHRGQRAEAQAVDLLQVGAVALLGTVGCREEGEAGQSAGVPVHSQAIANERGTGTAMAHSGQLATRKAPYTMPAVRQVRYTVAP